MSPLNKYAKLNAHNVAWSYRVQQSHRIWLMGGDIFQEGRQNLPVPALKEDVPVDFQLRTDSSQSVASGNIEKRADRRLLTRTFQGKLPLER